VLEYIFHGSGIGNVWLFLALGSLSAMLVSLAKAGFGGSIGILSMPLMVYACQGRTELALGVMLPILVACDQFSIVPWFGKWERRIVLLLLPGLVAGVVIGSVALYGITRLNLSERTHTGDAILMLGIGVIALGFVAIQIYRSLHPRPLPFRPVFWQGSAVGSLAGFTSTLSHAAGPIVTIYMLPQGLPKEKFVASTVLYYWVGNLIKLPPYYLLGMLDGKTFLLSLTLVPAVGVGVALGIFLHKRVGQKQFTGVVYVLLALAGTQLVISACRALAG
jgi:uncharacterized membrane protein YfcA